MSRELKPCPCGAIPDSIHVYEGGNTSKYAFASPACCGEWLIEFNTGYESGDKVQERAEKAWNGAERANLQAAKPEGAQTAVVLPEPDFDALARIRDEAIGELLKKLFNAAVKYAGTSGAGYSPASADAYHAAEEIKTQITSTVTAYSPTQAEIESYATAKTAEAVALYKEQVRLLTAQQLLWFADAISDTDFAYAVDNLLTKYAPKKEQG